MKLCQPLHRQLGRKLWMIFWTTEHTEFSNLNDNTKKTLCILYLLTVLVAHTMAQNESLIQKCMMRYHLTSGCPPPTIYLQALTATHVEIWSVGQEFTPVPLAYKTRIITPSSQPCSNQMSKLHVMVFLYLKTSGSSRWMTRCSTSYY
jgi:hypothetical protein